MKKILTTVIIAFVFLLMGSAAKAQDFVYTPINPAFGGNFYNYSWLLSSAQAQNTITEEQDAFSRYERDPLKDFENSLNQQILSQLSRRLIEKQFGEQDLTEGEYQIGNYQISIDNTGSGISVTILDSGTGNQTTITIPYF